MKKISALLLVLAVLVALTAFAACENNEKTYNVTFKNGDNVVATRTVKSGECVTELPTCETENGRKFEGWFVGETEFTVSTKVTDNLTAIAKITVDESVSFTLTLKLNENTVYETVSCKLDSKVDLYDYSVVDYEIHEWIDEDGKRYSYDELYVVRGDATLTAVNPVKLQFTMQLSDNGKYYIVTGLTDTAATAATIPETFFDLPVKEIAPSAFAAYNTTLKTLTVPDHIVKIGKQAFSGLCGLNELTVPFVGEELYTELAGHGEKALFAYWFGKEEPKTYREHYAYGASFFLDGDGEDNEENIAYAERYVPKSLVRVNINGGAISNFAFHTIVTVETVTLGDEVTAIGKRAFAINPQSTEIASTNYKLKEVICTENCKAASIGEDCFAAQSQLQKVCLPSKVKVIPFALFRGFEKLTDVVIFDNSELETIEENAFYGSAVKSVNLPQTLTTIKTHAFNSCNGLTEITIPKNAVDLGAGIVRNCANLETAVFAPTLKITEIPEFTFDSCLKLKTVKIPSTVVKFAKNAFNNCQTLSNLDDDEYGFELANVTYIGDGALASTAFRYIDISENITYIGSNAFSSCSKLEGIYFNDTSNNCQLTEIFGYTFDGCKNLKEITLPDSITEIGERAFSYTGLENIDLPANLQKLDARAFFQLHEEESKLTSVTDLGTLTNLTSIGDDAFLNNSKLVITSLPQSLTSIGDDAFRNTGIVDLVLNPATVTSIGENAFANCKNATLEVIGAVNDLPRKWNASWAGTGANSTAVRFTKADPDYVPLFEQFEGYEENEICYVTKYVGDDTEVVLQDSFAGKTVVYKQSVFAGNTTITSVTLAPNMTEIPRSFFSDCEKLQTVTVPAEAKITSIGDYAFNNCYKLTSFTISDASELTYIGGYAFYHAYSATFIEFTNNNKITYIGDYAFQLRLPTYNCALAELNLDLTKTEYIGEYAFQGCYDLVASYELTSNAESIGEAAFKGCSKINLTLKDGFKLSRFENGVFESVANLVWENVDFTDVEYIGDDAFHSTKALSGKKFTIPNTVTYIGNNAFHTTKAAGVIIDCNSELEIGDYAFGYGANNFYVVIKGTPKKIGYAICCTTDRAHIYFTEMITVSATYPRVFTLGNGGCEINSMFYIYNEDYEHAVNVPYFGKGQWTTGENGEPVHPTDGHKESNSSGGD